MSINYSIEGRTKGGVNYSIKDSLATFSSMGMNSLHHPSEVKILTFKDIQEPLKSHWLVQIGKASNGVSVRLTESEAELFSEALNIAIKEI